MALKHRQPVHVFKLHVHASRRFQPFHRRLGYVRRHEHEPNGNGDRGERRVVILAVRFLLQIKYERGEDDDSKRQKEQRNTER